jgi:DNA ligase D-like protein (predicted 3'-phosphoesterase)
LCHAARRAHNRGMPLDEYHAKRDFTKSPEPRGGTRQPVQGARRFFCVQKHLASHLHYDFRLEHDGVLLSWAVPKGPAIDPAVKRLAMQVEDHPVEYGTFEGVIPDGYGAGIVMLWDQGTWEPDSADIAAALRKGDLKFRLDGVKLKGSWALVRTRTAGERSWLLLKHRDEWSGPLDIAEFAPHSVKSGGDFADILASGDPAIWQSHRPARSGTAGQMFARIVERALALQRAEPPANEAEPMTEITGKAAAGGPAAVRKASARSASGAKKPKARAAASGRSSGRSRAAGTKKATGRTAAKKPGAASTRKASQAAPRKKRP